jgi:hypothetical protein
MMVMSSPSEKVIQRVADAKGKEPGELDPPLFNVVDPDGLDALFEPVDNIEREIGLIRFLYHGYKVTVLADGSVSLQSHPMSAQD